MSGKRTSRLGRGLSSLIDLNDVTHASRPLPDPPGLRDERTTSGTDVRHPPAVASAAGGAWEVETDRVSVNPHQPRRSFADESIDELAMSLKSNGVIQPLIVRRLDDARYELIAGERRLRAAKRAGLSKVPVVIRNVDAFEQAQLALVENVQREDLNPVERAEAYESLIDQLGLTQSELADRLGEQRSTIANHVRLLDLTPGALEHVRAGRLSLGHAKVLAGVEDRDRQIELAEKAASQSLSVRNLERLLELPLTSSAGEAKPQKSTHVTDLQRRMSRQLGTRVVLTSSRQGRGKIILHYKNLDEFERIAAQLGVEIDAQDH